MADDEGAALVVAHFDEIVKPDGGSVRLVSREGTTLRVAYAPGVNEECATCVIPADQLGAMMLDLLRDHAPGIEHVEVAETTAT